MNENTPQPIARVLAEFTVGLRPQGLPAALQEKVKLHLLDTLGDMLAGSTAPFASMVQRVVAEMGGRPEATAARMESRLPAALAALVNASLAHGQDYDDTHSGSITHPSAPVLATAMTMAERQGASGAEMLAAAVAGYEVTIRTGLAAHGALHAKGFYTNAICAAFGATAIAGKLLGLDAGQLTNALGIVGSQAAGIGEFNFDGSWVKRLHPSWAAHSGIIAALLAQQGFTGPARVLEGSYGLYRTHLGDEPIDYERLQRGLGSEWNLFDASIKLYPSCHHNHGPLDAILELRRQHDLKAEDIREMTCYVPREALPLVCEPLDLKLNPPTSYAAQFSLQFSVAAALIEGHGLMSIYSEESLRNPRILELTQRVGYAVDPETLFPAAYGGAVDVTLKDGRKLHLRVAACKGSPQNPASPEDVRDKFFANVQGILSGDDANRMADLALRVDALQDVRGLASLYGARPAL